MKKSELKELIKECIVELNESQREPSYIPKITSKRLQKDIDTGKTREGWWDFYITGTRAMDDDMSSEDVKSIIDGLMNDVNSIIKSAKNKDEFIDKMMGLSSNKKYSIVMNFGKNNRDYIERTWSIANYKFGG